MDIFQTKTENNVTISKNSCLEQQTYGANALLKKLECKKYIKFNLYFIYNINSEKNESIENNQIFNQENTF